MEDGLRQVGAFEAKNTLGQLLDLVDALGACAAH